MRGTAQDILLDLAAQLHEIGAVPGHAHQQALVVLGPGLGAAQDLMADHIELHVEDVQVQKGLQKGGKTLPALRTSALGLPGRGARKEWKSLRSR